FDTTSTAGGHTTHVTTPARGASDPLMTVISRDHLGDLDVDNHALDVFDVVRMLRHRAWGDPIAHAGAIDLDRDGRVTDADIRRATALIVDNDAAPAHVPDPTASIDAGGEAATMRFLD